MKSPKIQIKLKSTTIPQFPKRQQMQVRITMTSGTRMTCCRQELRLAL